MAGIAFYFEEKHKDVYSGRRVDLDAWNYASKLAGDIDRAIIVNQTDVDLQPFDRKVETSIVETMPALPGLSAYLVTPWEGGLATPLWEFNHDVDWYVFGPASAPWTPGPLQVTIPQAGQGACHSVHIATVVMAHRYTVIGRS